MAKQTYTTSEAAEALGVSPARVRQMVLDGTLPAEKFGRDLVITTEALEIARQRKTTRGPDPKPKASGADGKVNVKPSKKGSKS